MANQVSKQEATWLVDRMKEKVQRIRTRRVAQLGRTVRALREKRKLSREELANQAEVPYYWLQALEEELLGLDHLPYEYVERIAVLIVDLFMTDELRLIWLAESSGMSRSEIPKLEYVKDNLPQ